MDSNILNMLRDPYFYYWLLATAFSLFYGFYAIRVFLPIKSQRDDLPKKSKAWFIHQFWLNFSGSALGWIILFFLLKYFLGIEQENLLSEFNTIYIILTFLAFIGITGHIPTTIVGIVNSIALLVNKVAEIIAKK